MAEDAGRYERMALAQKAVLARKTAFLPGPSWIYSFVSIQLVCQLALLVQQLVSVRALIRSAAFGTSLLFLLVIPTRTQRWGTVQRLALAILTILTLSALNPLGGAPIAVVAHWAFHLAIIAPVFWVARLNTSGVTLGRVILLLWGFHAVGSVLGVLQAYYPGSFQPDLTTIADRKHLFIRLASGDWIPRPTGLSDTPGGASSDGLYAALFGLGVALVRPFKFARAAGLASMVLGIVCVYLSQVRAALVMLVICFIALPILFTASGRLSRAASAALVALTVGVIGFFVALSLGGSMMSTRVESLIVADPATVYQHSRGSMLEDALFRLIPLYPLGAGLGHWGMMNAYFGSAEEEIGAEIQIGGWILDGGLPLLVVYSFAVLAAIWLAGRSALTRDPSLAVWGAIITAYGVGAYALCFSYPFFMGTPGLEFWLVTTLLAQEAARPSAAFPVRAS